MPRRSRSPKTSGPRARLIVPVVCTLVALVAAGRGIATAWIFRGPLAEVLGGGFIVWQVLLAATGLSCIGAVVHRVWAWRRGGGPERPWAQVRLMLYVLTAATVVSVLWLQPVRGPVAQMHLGVAAGVFLALMIAGERAPRLGARFLPTLDLGLLLVVAALLSAELVLVSWNHWKPSPLLARPGGTAAEHVDRESLQAGALVRGFPVNTLGDYDTELDPDVRPLVVTVGDSFSLGIVPYPYHFTTVAEERLSRRHAQEVEVYNVGLPTLGPKEYLHLIESKVLGLEPDLIVVALFVGNDINQALNRGSWDMGGWAWLDADHWLVALAVTRLGILSGQPLAEDAAPEASEGDEGWKRGDPRIDALRAGSAETSPWLVNPDLERSMMTEAAHLNIETTRARRICSEWTSAYDMLFELLEEMRAASAPTPLLVAIIPDEFQVEDQLWEQIVERTAGEQLDRFQPQRLLVDGLAARGIPALDLLPALRAAPVELGPDGQERRRVYHLRDTHINASGNRRVGDALGDFLAEHLD